MGIVTSGGHRSGQDARGPKTSPAEKGVTGHEKSPDSYEPGFRVCRRLYVHKPHPRGIAESALPPPTVTSSTTPTTTARTVPGSSPRICRAPFPSSITSTVSPGPACATSTATSWQARAQPSLIAETLRSSVHLPVVDCELVLYTVANAEVGMLLG